MTRRYLTSTWAPDGVGPDPGALGQGEVRVLLAPSTASRDADNATLSDVERAAITTLRRPVDRLAARTSRVLLRHAVAAALGRQARSVSLGRHCHACGGTHGAPAVLDEPGLRVSLSHTTDVVAVALHAGEPVGVDVELCGDGFLEPGMAEQVLSATEIARGPTNAHGLAVTWARKESLLKASGHGLTVPPATLTLTPVREAPRLLSGPGLPGSRECWLSDIHLPELDEFRAVASVSVLEAASAPAPAGTAGRARTAS